MNYLDSFKKENKALENVKKLIHKKKQGKKKVRGSKAGETKGPDRKLPYRDGEMHEATKNRIVALIVEGRFAADGSLRKPSQRAFDVGQKMADREHKNPDTAKTNKKRREKLKKSGIHGAKSVSAGMAKKSKELRGEDSY